MSAMNRKMTLRNHFIFTAYLSIVLSVILICVVSYVLLSSNSRKFAIQASNEVVQQKSGEIDTKLRGLEVTVRDVIYSPDLQKILSDRKSAVEDSLYMRRVSVNHTISRASNSLYMIDNIAVFSRDGEMIGSMFEFDTAKKARSYPWYSQAAGSNGETVWLKDSVEMATDNYGPHVVISAVKKIRSVYVTDLTKIGQDLGYVYFTLNLDSMLNFSHSDYSNQGRKVFVVSGDSHIIGGSDMSRRGSMFAPELLKEKNNNTYVDFEGKEYLLTYGPTDASVDWYTVCLTERSFILKDAHMAILVCAGVSVVLLAAFYYLSARNAESLSRPIRRLETEFEMVERGDFNIEIRRQTGIREVDNLFSRFHLMAYRLDNLIHEVYEAKIKEQNLIVEARQAQLQSLQMQINPHFLYNTLDSINWMALMDGNEDVSKMILALGHLFRNNMNTTGIYTTAREEIENVKLYMYLEQVRFGGRLDYRVEAGEQVLEAVMLKHILQPLVENSIKYGIEPYHIKGEILISLTKQQEKLSVIVSDNGRGMNQETLNSLQGLWDGIAAAGDTGEEKKQGGVGIRNIMRRLWLCYGAAAVFIITSNSQEGTRMELSFPLTIPGGQQELSDNIRDREII